MNKSVLQLLVKISETENFTKAGLELNMTQPAVSRAVRTLEEELGVTLLTRNRRQGIVLTQIGERIIRIFREILDNYEKIDQEIAREKGLETGLVRIGAFPVAAAYFIPKIISHIAKRYPNIEFTIIEGTVTDIREWIDQRRIDIGFIIPPTDKYDTFRLHREGLYAVLRDDHPLSEKESIQAADLLDETMIVCKAGYESPVFEWFESYGKKVQVKYTLYNNLTALNLIKEGLGISIMADLSLQNLPESVVVRRLEPPGYRDILLAIQSFEDCSIAVKLFIETAQTLFFDNPR